MQLLKKVPLMHQNKDYEIRVLFEDNVINAVVFYDNRPANGYRHRILLPEDCNVNNLLATEIVDELIAISKSDVTEGRGDKLTKVIRENRVTA
ncbi:MAG: hypothetical protein QNK27_09820 [Desulfuromusa sp.]|nr:hypothetical protein [Desulfuromusa sp.]